MVAVDSPDYFQPVEGGDLSVTTEQTLNFPMYDTALDTSESQDGTTGDPWSVIGKISGVAGSFLKTFTGSPTISVGTTPKPPTAAPAKPGGVLGSSATTWMIGGAVLLVVLILVLGKR